MVNKFLYFLTITHTGDTWYNSIIFYLLSHDFTHLCLSSIMNHQDLTTISQIENYSYCFIYYKILQILEIAIKDCPIVLKFLDYFYSSKPFLWIYSITFCLTSISKLSMTSSGFLQLANSSLEYKKNYCIIYFFRMRCINYIFTVMTLL